jgi:hypothetical protein
MELWTTGLAVRLEKKNKNMQYRRYVLRASATRDHAFGQDFARSAVVVGTSKTKKRPMHAPIPPT